MSELQTPTAYALYVPVLCFSAVRVPDNRTYGLSPFDYFSCACCSQHRLHHSLLSRLHIHNSLCVPSVLDINHNNNVFVHLMSVDCMHSCLYCTPKKRHKPPANFWIKWTLGVKFLLIITPFKLFMYVRTSEDDPQAATMGGLVSWSGWHHTCQSHCRFLIFWLHPLYTGQEGCMN